MFWRKQKAWDRKKADFKSAIRVVYEHGRIRLALARASYFVGYNVTTGPGEKVLESATEYKFAGVLYEEGPGGSHVSCDIEFNDARVDDGIIGQCVLTFETLSERERIEDRPLTLEVKLHDPERKYRHIAYNAMRDAAISGNRFMHLEIKTDRVDETEAIRSLQEKGYGPPQRIYHLRFFPQIILPNAPSWGWKRDGEI